MKILGAIVAGGHSTRFGSDKALATIDGRALIEHAIGALEPQVDTVVLCGREWPGVVTIPDRPTGGIGPLGGLNAALHHAAQVRLDDVLCVPVDVWALPGDLRRRLAGSGPAVFAVQHLIGLWPALLAEKLDDHIAQGGRSLRGWIVESRARLVTEPPGMRNINYRFELLNARIPVVGKSNFISRIRQSRPR